MWLHEFREAVKRRSEETRAAQAAREELLREADEAADSIVSMTIQINFYDRDFAVVRRTVEGTGLHLGSWDPYIVHARDRARDEYRNIAAKWSRDGWTDPDTFEHYPPHRIRSIEMWMEEGV